MARLVAEEQADREDGHAAADAFAGRLATVIQVFANGPRWRLLGVDPDRPLDRSGGTGDQPPHMDFVNASLPPDYVFLYCARPDPLGGGASLVAADARGRRAHRGRTATSSAAPSSPTAGWSTC